MKSGFHISNTQIQVGIYAGLEDMLLMGPTETDRAESMPFKM